MMIDTSVFLGSWPFAHLPYRSAAGLEQHLRARHIRHALVSHLDAVFACDPMPANRRLLAATRRSTALIPVPILNPMLAVAQEHLDECCRLVPRLRAIRIMPGYHGVRLRSARMGKFVAALQTRGLKLIINLRLVDARLDYDGMRIPPVRIAALSAFLRAHPQLQPLISCPTLNELRALLRTGHRFEADIPFVEWLYSIETLLRAGAPSRFMFGSHTPFFVTEANINKLADAAIPPKARDAIAWRNAARAFSLPSRNTPGTAPVQQ